MKLLTKEIEERVKKIGSQENIEEPEIVDKFFDTNGSWTWYDTEYDHDTKTLGGLLGGY